MKKVIRIIAIQTVGLFVASTIASGLSFQDQFEGLLITGVALGVATMLVKPILNILLLPLTLATLGLFKFLSNAITLYIVDIGLTQFSVNAFEFPGLTSKYLDLPPVKLSPGVLSYIGFALVISVVSGVINWLRK